MWAKQSVQLCVSYLTVLKRNKFDFLTLNVEIFFEILPYTRLTKILFTT